MGLRARCGFEAVFKDERSAKSALIAISHEKDVGSRSSVKSSVEGKVLRIVFEADDIVALRASMNAHLRALAVFEGIESAVV